MRAAQGNLLDAKVDALVNTVNTVGVMGKGIALQFKEAFPDNYRDYRSACQRGEVRLGHMFVTERGSLAHPRWIVNFPTKAHWRGRTDLQWIQDGLVDLRRVITEKAISSIAIPPLGCGHGGLSWAVVRPEIERALGDLSGVDVVLYEPTAQYQNVAKRSGLERLTPARALIAELVRRYWILGIPCSLLEIQKLAYFLQRDAIDLGLEDPLKLRFAANRYGPYSDQLRHLLDGLDGSYLRSDVRIADAKPTTEIAFADSRRERVATFLRTEAKQYLGALDATSRRIEGFESPLGMELLATVDWLLAQQGRRADVAGIRAGLAAWPGPDGAARRKLRLFDERLIGLALERLGPPSARANPL